jgi:DNA polymerase I
LRYLIDVRYNADTDNPVYTFFNEETQRFDTLVIPREDMYSYFLQRNMSEKDVREVFEAASMDPAEPSNALQKIVRIGKTRKYNLFTEEWEDVAKIEMQTAMDVRDHRFETCHEGHIRRVTRHMLDKRWYMGMPYDEFDQLIVPDIEQKYKQDLTDSGYPEDVVEQMLGWTFTKIPEISTVAFDIETEKHGDLAPNPMYAATPIISAAFKFHNVKGAHKPGIVLMLSNELRRLENNEPNQVLREMVKQNLIEMEIFHTEYELIMRIIEVLNDPDYPLCVTYYGEAFDLPYLYNRAVNLGINKKRIPFRAYRLKGHKSTKGARTDWKCKFDDKMHIDLLQFFAQPVVMNYVFKDKYNRVGLENVSQAILGRGKIEHKEDINDMSLSTLAYYNFIDADLTLELVRRDDFLLLKVVFMFMRFGRQDYYEAAHRAIGNKILNLVQGYMTEHDILIPNRADLELVGTAHSNPDIKGKGYRGAIVIPYVMGILRKVQSMDFGSLYPSMMRERNISFETVNCKHPECQSSRVPELPHHICTKKLGIMPILIGCIKDIRLKYFKPWSSDKTLPEKERNTYKAIEQAQKVFVNASYGVFGTQSFGLVCMPVAESITAWARDAITRVIIKAEGFRGNDLVAIAEEYGEEPLDAINRIPPEERVTKGGDTDSGHFEGLTDEEKQYLIDYSADELKVVLEAERESEIMVSYLKKNYIMVDKDGKVTVKGMLGKKRNTPNIAVLCFEEYKELLKKVVFGELTEEKLKEETVNLVRSYYDKIWNVKGEISDYTIEMQMTKPIDGYKMEPQHVKAAKKWAKYVRATYTALSSASDSAIVPQGSYIRFVKKAESGIRSPKPGKKTSNIKCDPIPFQIATRDDVSPVYYHSSLLSVMDQVMLAMGISRSEVMTVDPEQSTLEDFM